MNITFGLLDEAEYIVLNEDLYLNNRNYADVEATGDTIFYIKRHDTLPHLIVRLKNELDIPLDLATNSPSVYFTMKNSSTGALSISANPCSILIPEQGIVRYTWQVGDTAVAGDFSGEFEVVYSYGKFTVPTEKTFTILIIEDYNNL